MMTRLSSQCVEADCTVTRASAGSTAAGQTHRPTRDALLIGFVAAVVFFAKLGAPALWDEDEPKNAACAAEMLARDDWLVPSFNDELRTDKPILIYWLMQAAYRLFGVNEFGARFSSALLSVGTCLLTWRIGWRLYGPATGFWAGIVLATCLLPGISARAATTDATLVFCTTLSFALFAETLSNLPSPDAARLSCRQTISLYAALGLAVLAKGPTGFLLPAVVLFIHCWHSEFFKSEQSSQTFLARTRSLITAAWRATCRLRLFAGTAIMLAVALPWYLLVGVATDWDWPTAFLGRHNFGRYFDTMEGHAGSPLYYFLALLLGTVPWSLPAATGLVDAARRRLRRTDSSAADWLMLTWIGTYVVFFSFSRTKLPSYVLPCFPALAVLTGRSLQGWLSQATPWFKHLWRSTFGGAALMGLAILVATPLVGAGKLPNPRILALVGLLPLVGGAAALVLSGRGKFQQGLWVFTATAVAFLTTLYGPVATQVAAQQTSKPTIAALRAAGMTDRPIAAFGYFRPGLVFYSRKRVEHLWSAIQVEQFLNRHPDACLITRGNRVAEMQSILPPDMVIVDRRQAFLRNDREIVTLSRPSAVRVLADGDDATSAASSGKTR